MCSNSFVARAEKGNNISGALPYLTRTSDPEINMTKAKILIVDDELELERLIKQRLKKHIRAKEFELLFAHNGKEALEKLQSEQAIEMVLTDINMPEMDGLTLLGLLPEIDQTLKAVVVSAYGDMSNIRTAMNRGAFDFLVKPIDFDDLKVTIQKTLKFVKQLRKQQQQLQEALGKLQEMAFYDQLTKLPNRSLVLHRIAAAMCLEQVQQQDNIFAILFIYLDSYPIVKYGLGHELSDRLLVEMAQRLEKCVQPIDTVARVGTNEFAILLKDIKNMDEAIQKAEQIHQEIKVPFQLNGSLVSSSTYIGIADSTIDYEEPEDFLRAADTAMNHAKVQEGVNTAVFVPSMQTGATKRLKLEADLQEALDHEQLELLYQPIVSLQTNRIVSLEALVRWEHPQKGTIMPMEFIPLAEETGLIVPLGKWVLLKACQKLKQWQEKFQDNCPDNISVNLSGIQISNSDLLKSIDETLEESGLNGSSLKLEITESILMKNGSAAIDLLKELKKRDIKLSIDDFGTGYSSLAYLQSFPIDTLKIDRSFIKDIQGQGKNLDIAKTIITLAHSLGLDAIAEGIENQEQLETLKLLGCDCAQGYLISRPMKGEAVVDFIEKVNT